MALNTAPDLFVFARRLRNTVNTKNFYVQAFAFAYGEQRLKLTRKTMAGMAGRPEGYVGIALSLYNRIMRMDQPVTAHAFIQCYLEVIVPTKKGSRV